tara:strand:- start:1234 stop:3597 length:2364 start_codon:yes stop_codon:yes gene_type:complete
MAVDDPTNPLNFYEEMRRALEDQGRTSSDILGDLQAQLELLQELQLAESSRLVKMERQKVIEELTLDVNKRKAQDMQERLKDMEEITASEMAILKLLQAQQKAAKAIPSLTETLFSGDKGGTKLIGQISGIGNSIESSLTENLNRVSQTSLDLQKIIQAGMTGGIKGAAIEAATQFSKIFAAAAMLALAKYAIEAIKLASSLADMEAGFMEATGASKEFARSVTVAYNETRRFGASAEDTSKAAQALFGTFTDFTFQNIKTREQLIETTAVLDKLGIDSQTTAKSIQFMTKSMGMSPGGAARSMLNLEKFAENLGVPVKQLGADFAANASSLGKLGSNGEAAFKRLAIAAKTTGLEMQKILNITNKFDTFEDAAKQAGKLNAALGGNFVNAMDLMMATDPAERFDLIRDSILDAGLSFDSMSYYQRKFYADSLGLSDVNDLALILSGNMDMVAGATQQSSQSIEDAAKRAREMATLQEKLNILFAQMIPILTPVIDLLTDMAQFLSDNARMIKLLVGVTLLLGGVLAAVFSGGALTPILGAIAAMTLGTAGIADSFDTSSESVTAFGSFIRELYLPFKTLFVLIKEVFFYVNQALIPALNSINRVLGTNMTFIDLFIKSWEYLIKFALLPIIKAAKALNVALMAIRAGIALASLDIDKAAEIFNEMGHVLFQKPFASSFLEGLVKIGNAFEFIGSMAVMILSPIASLSSAFIKVGETFSNLPFINFGGANANVNVTNTTAGTNNAATSGGTNKIQQPIQIEINGNKLAEFVLEVTGERLYSVAALQK